MDGLTGQFIRWFAEKFQRTFLLIVFLVAIFPIVTTMAMWAERVGLLTDVYRAEHADLKQIIMRSVGTQESLVNNTKSQGDILQRQAHYNQRTCINTAPTNEEKLKCLQ